MSKQTIWKTIKIGDKKEYKFSNDIRVSDWAKDIQSKTPLSKKKENIDLVVLTPKDLGFEGNVTIKELFDEENLAKYGVELCPAEVGLALREQYLDQPKNEWLYVAMLPIRDSDGCPDVFYVERDDSGFWLLAGCANPARVWRGDRRFVFRSRKISTKTSDTQPSLDPLNLELRIKSLEEDMLKIKKFLII
jgi:hypothetical protein